MSLLNISNLSFSYDSAREPIFSSINYTFTEGWTALIGANGCGKTTLLNLIAKRLQPTDGKINSDSVIYLCPQDSPEDLPEVFYNPDLINLPFTNKLFSQLEIEDDWSWKWENLSGGEKKRCMIADSLAHNPDILLVDEPVNHLDLYSMNLLSNELRQFSGIGILISHDLSFLDSVCTKTIIIEPSPVGSILHPFDCSPSVALKEREQNIIHLRDLKSKQIKKVETLELQKNSELVNVQAIKNRLSKKNIAKKDHSAKRKIDAARLTGKSRKTTDKISKLNTIIEKNNNKLQKMDVPSQRKSGINLRGTRSESTQIIALQAQEINLIENLLELKIPEIKVLSTDRIIITGNNGAGKTSFIKYLCQSLDKKNRNYWYLKQEYSKEERIKVKNKILALDKSKQGEVFSIVYRLGSNPLSIMASNLMSPGETQKMLYGLAMISNVSLLILDEPTNYLDIIATKALIDAIGEFNGALIAVTHDMYFKNSIGLKNWNFVRNSSEVTLFETFLEKVIE